MKWYVRRECGAVDGPMSEEDARFNSERLDGAVMYNERIFEPQFVTSEEVEELLAELRNCRELDTPLCESAVELCQRAVDTIILLSAKTRRVELEMTVDTTRLLLDLEKVLVGDLREQTVQAIVSLSAKRVVRGSIKEGTLILGEVPEGVRVVIRDYDTVAGMRSGSPVSLCDPELLKTDGDGNDYFEVGR